MKIKNLIDDYYKSFDFKELRDGTKEQYKYFLQVVMDTNVENKNLGNRNIEKISTRMAKLAYNEWCQRGISMANFLLSTTRIVYNYAIHMEICNTNPFSAVKKRVTKRRKVVWSKEQVKKFLDTAYSNFGTRNVGLIAQEELEVEKEHGFGDTPDNMLITHIDDGGGYGMQYSKLVPILINAVKELSAKVEELESKLNN